jgi:hypothetical protein
MIFSDVVEAIKNLSAEEKHEIQLLLQQYLREERRDEIYDNFKSAQVEQHQGELKFSSNINQLRQLIEERSQRIYGRIVRTTVEITP